MNNSDFDCFGLATLDILIVLYTGAVYCKLLKVLLYKSVPPMASLNDNTLTEATILF